MSNISMTFLDATFTRVNAKDQFDLILGVEATIRIFVQGKLVYSEPMFPVVELRQALSDWLPEMRTDFSFVSMESDQAGLLWFKRQPSTHWRAGSIYQETAANDELSVEEVTAECMSFIKRVDTWVQSELGVRVSSILSGSTGDDTRQASDGSRDRCP